MSRTRFGATLGAVIGLWLGVADGAFALHRAPDLAGPWADRAGTIAVAMAMDALLLALLGAMIGLAAKRLAGSAMRVVRPAGGRHTTPVFAALGAALLATAVVSFGWAGEPRSTAAARPNVLLISVDTLRPDRLGSYGNPESPSPKLDELARQGIVFEDAYSHSSWTLPAHVSAFTGLDPFAHGVVAKDDRLGLEFVTLAELLRDAGYWTGAWVGTPPFGFLGARHGLDQGFAAYQHTPHPRRFSAGVLARALDRLTRTEQQGRLGAGSHLADSVVSWLRGPGRGDFFVFVHFYDVHSKFAGLPYEAPEPFRSRLCPQPIGAYDGCRDGLCATNRLHAMAAGQESRPRPSELEQLRCLYDGGVAFVDHQIGRILDTLDDEGLADDTIVIVMADHGEAFFEHGVPLHVTLHEEVLRIPLIVRLPGGAAGKRVHGAVRLIDLAPTVLDLVGLEAPGALQGTSLRDVLVSWPAEPPEAAVLAADHRSDSVALVRGSEKIIRNGNARQLRPMPALERYDLVSDPSEQRNRAIADERDAPKETLALMRQLQAASEALHHSLADPQASISVDLSEAEREKLRALGYVGDDEE